MTRLIHQYDASGLESCPVHNSDCRIYERGVLRKFSVHVTTLTYETPIYHGFLSTHIELMIYNRDVVR